MTDIATKIRSILKEEDKELLSELESNNVSDEEIERMMSAIYAYLDNESNKDFDVKLIIKDGKIFEDYVPKSKIAKEQERLLKVKSNYLT